MADNEHDSRHGRMEADMRCARTRRAVRCARPAQEGAFTLIELLVVIAIISLLVSILIPSLKRAKELTRRVVCSSNLHQMGVALVTYSADHKGDFPEGGRTGAAAYFSDFYGRGWKNSLYPKYIQVPELCYCPSAGYGPEPYYYYWEHAGDPNSAIIAYAYTPNQQTVKEDIDGNAFPTNAEEAYSTSVVMTDLSTQRYGDYWGVPEHWNHLFGDAQGGNWMGGDGHVEWRSYGQQKVRVVHGSPPAEWSHERFW